MKKDSQAIMRRDFSGLTKLAGRSSTYSRVVRLLTPVLENARQSVDSTRRSIANAPDITAKQKIFEDFMAYKPNPNKYPNISEYLTGVHGHHRFDVPSQVALRDVFDPSGSLSSQYTKQQNAIKRRKPHSGEVEAVRRLIDENKRRDIAGGAQGFIDRRLHGARDVAASLSDEHLGNSEVSLPLTDALKKQWGRLYPGEANAFGKQVIPGGPGLDAAFQGIDFPLWQTEARKAIEGWEGLKNKRLAKTIVYPAAQSYANAHYAPINNTVAFVPRVDRHGNVLLPEYTLRHEFGHGADIGHGFWRSLWSGLSSAATDAAATHDVIPGAREATLRKMTGVFKHSPGTLGQEYRASRFAMDGKDYKDWVPELQHAYDTYLLSRLGQMNRLRRLSPREYRLALRNYPEILMGI